MILTASQISNWTRWKSLPVPARGAPKSLKLIFVWVPVALLILTNPRPNHQNGMARTKATKVTWRCNHLSQPELGSVQTKTRRKMRIICTRKTSPNTKALVDLKRQVSTRTAVLRELIPVEKFLAVSEKPTWTNSGCKYSVPTRWLLIYCNKISLVNTLTCIRKSKHFQRIQEATKTDQELQLRPHLLPRHRRRRRKRRKSSHPSQILCYTALSLLIWTHGLSTRIPTVRS